MDFQLGSNLENDPTNREMMLKLSAENLDLKYQISVISSITTTQTYTWESQGALLSTWESPKHASNLCSLLEAQGVDSSKRKSFVDTIFRIRRKIEILYFFSILGFADVPAHHPPILHGLPG